jgi:oligopeptidase B
LYAIAHVRGGGDLGAYWHVDGMLMDKRNTFTDFITCAEHLIEARPLYEARAHLRVSLQAHPSI